MIEKTCFSLLSYLTFTFPLRRRHRVDDVMTKNALALLPVVGNNGPSLLSGNHDMWSVYFLSCFIIDNFNFDFYEFISNVSVNIC